MGLCLKLHSEPEHVLKKARFSCRLASMKERNNLLNHKNSESSRGELMISVKGYAVETRNSISVSGTEGKERKNKPE